MNPVIYEFRVEGRLPEHARDAFCDMRLEETPPGLVLRGSVIDDSHLLGIISEFRQLGLTLTSAHPVAAGGTRAAALPISRSATSRDNGPFSDEGKIARRAARRLARHRGEDRPHRGG